jgi:hypothetical protein
MTYEITASSGAKITVEKIGPDRAADILEHHNGRSRSLTAKTTGKYVRAIEANEWPFLGDPIRFDHQGDLLDGQHRLAAVVETGTVIEFVLIHGILSRSNELWYTTHAWNCWRSGKSIHKLQLPRGSELTADKLKLR